MEDAEREICLYLKGVPEQFISTREICRRAGGKWRFREDEEWAVPILRQMVQKGFVEEDANGHYRAVDLERAAEKKERKQAWVAPHIQNILTKGGVNVAKTFDLGNPVHNGYIKLKEPAQQPPG
jgi:hypothetical protein